MHEENLDDLYSSLGMSTMIRFRRTGWAVNVAQETSLGKPQLRHRLGLKIILKTILEKQKWVVWTHKTDL